jgi:hypothetical protein
MTALAAVLDGTQDRRTGVLTPVLLECSQLHTGAAAVLQTPRGRAPKE